jgi:hypothetical protein
LAQGTGGRPVSFSEKSGFCRGGGWCVPAQAIEGMILGIAFALVNISQKKDDLTIISVLIRVII